MRDFARSTQWYSELGALISTAPDLSLTRLTTEAMRWAGRVSALLAEIGDTSANIDFQTAFKYRLGTTLDSSESQREKMQVALYKALAVAERLAPASAAGNYIPVGSPHDALIAIAPVLGEARKDILIVDPYLSQVVINDFALSANDGITIRLLTGDKRHDADLEPAVRRWREQRRTRPLEVRLAKQKMLHDRVIIPDGTAWSLSQSFNMLAKRSPATLQPFEPEIGKLKAAYYEAIWQEAPLLDILQPE